jgi:phosphoenolpyruvate-protein phosphotransferase (PTS system enzyme I)
MKGRSPSRKESAVLRGIGASPGIATGKAFILARERVTVPRRQIPADQVKQELHRFQAAVAEAQRELQNAKEQVAASLPREALLIMDAHLLLLADEMMVGHAAQLIEEEQINAEWALRKVLDELSALFRKMKDSYLRERGQDIEVVGEVLLRRLVGSQETSLAGIAEPVIVVAHDLSPAETAQLAGKKILGFATDVGSRTSHTAIVASSLQIPAVVGLERITREVSPGDLLILDGSAGTVVLNPTEKTRRDYQERKHRLQVMARELRKFVNLPAETLDGHHLRLAANLEILEEIKYLKDAGAEGLGLFRTEYLYLDRNDLPSEEEHYQHYRRLIEAVSPFSATLRTFDLGGDKFASQLNLADEMNPALGLRAIRFCLASPGIFKTQLRGILRASAHGPIRVMFPMVSGFHEIREAKRLLREAEAELDREGIPFDHQIQVGMMVEVPSAAQLADRLAKEVAFFSIGTNDLIQYILAIDRINEHVSYLYEPLHPAVLQVIRQVVEAGHAAGIEVHMCGEMASDPLHLPLLLGLGFDELSMPATNIPRLKKILRGIKKSDAEAMAREVFRFDTAREVLEYVRAEIQSRWAEAYSLELPLLTTARPTDAVLSTPALGTEN